MGCQWRRFPDLSNGFQGAGPGVYRSRLQPAPFHRGGRHRYNDCLTENCHFLILALSASLQVGAALR